MNTTSQEREKGERIARALMKALALVGLVAILILIAWGTLKLGGLLPTVRGTLTGGVVSLDALFGSREEETLNFSLERKVLQADREAVVPFVHTNPQGTRTGYEFSYGCKNGVVFNIRKNGTWEKVTCGTSFEIPANTTSLTLIATSKETRYVDVPLTIRTTATEPPLSDMVVVTVENTSVSASRDALLGTTSAGTDATKETTEPDGLDVPTETETPVAAPVTPPITTRPVTYTPAPAPIPTGPADLSVSITGTGILPTPSKTTSFVTRSVIPSDATAAVRFVVSNVGGTASGPWGFIANLPIEGDADYKYTSPLQSSLKPGGRIEFTLSFDEVRNASTGAITITLVPGSTTDNSRNNRDTRIITISEE